MKELDALRKKIDIIDEKLLDLLNERGNIVKEIAKVKKELNLSVYQPKREKKVIKRLQSFESILQPRSIEAIWKEIMGACKVLQGSTIKVGYLGPKGTFTHQAALEFFSKAETKFISCKNILQIFENIEKDILEYGVIPIENSLQGTVRDTLDLLIEKNLIIFGELELRIVQNLIGLKETNISNIKTIYSHPQAFAQTRLWIKTNIPNIKLENTNSTAEAVKTVRDMRSNVVGAIGTEFAAEVYGLSILSRNIEDNPSNFTRFLIISKKENKFKEGQKVKTSIVYVTKHVPGALFNVLKIFADADINLLKIESRPRRRGRWEYIFLMDFEGDKDEEKVQKVLDSMKDFVIWHKVLGSYPHFAE